jgi:hypothetical protein
MLFHFIGSSPGIIGYKVLIHVIALKYVFTAVTVWQFPALFPVKKVGDGKAEYSWA